MTKAASGASVIALSLFFAGICALAAIGGADLADAAASDAAFRFAFIVSYTLLPLVGAISTLLTLNEVLSERALVGSDDTLARISSGNVRREIFRLFQMVSLMMLGLLTLFGIQTPWTGAMLLLFVTILLVTNSILDRIERRKTTRVIREALVAARRGGSLE